MLIGIYSPVPQSGKSTVADYLESTRDFARVPFAQVLKYMMEPLLETIGVDSSALWSGDKSALVYQDKTLRHALQTLGTEWGRRCMGEDFWVEVWNHNVRNWLAAGHHVVVDDMRFPNEFAAVQALGGWTWKVIRPGAGSPTLGHASEGALEHLIFDTELINGGTLDDLKATVETALRVGGRNDGRQEAVQTQG